MTVAVVRSAIALAILAFAAIGLPATLAIAGLALGFLEREHFDQGLQFACDWINWGVGVLGLTSALNAARVAWPFVKTWVVSAAMNFARTHLGDFIRGMVASEVGAQLK